MYKVVTLSYNQNMTNDTHINTDESQYEKAPRAGLIPFIRSDRGIEYLMMIASDPKFGGPRPMISKGKIEDGETQKQAALREAEEELGFNPLNIRGEVMDLADERVELRTGAYQLTLYAVEIADRHDFSMWCDETEYTQWFTLEEFQEQGRRDHVKFVERLHQIVRTT